MKKEIIFKKHMDGNIHLITQVQFLKVIGTKNID